MRYITKKIICVLSFIVFIATHSLEKRALIKNIDNVKDFLTRNNAYYKESYQFTDLIYFPIAKSKKIGYARIRMYPNNFDVKRIVLTIKSPSQIVLHKSEHAQINEALAFIKDEFTYAFTFSRRGWEYCWRNCRLFLEEIENLPPSLEIIAETQAEIAHIFELIHASAILDQPVPLLYKHFASNVNQT